MKTSFLQIPYIQASYASYADNMRKHQSKYSRYPRNISIETQVRFLSLSLISKTRRRDVDRALLQAA